MNSFATYSLPTALSHSRLCSNFSPVFIPHCLASDSTLLIPTDFIFCFLVLPLCFVLFLPCTRSHYVYTVPTALQKYSPLRCYWRKKFIYTLLQVAHSLKYRFTPKDRRQESFLKI